jgi:hypothetical protein
MRSVAFVVLAALTLYVPFTLAEPKAPAVVAAKGKDAGVAILAEGGATSTHEAGPLPAATRPEPATKVADAGASVTEARGDAGRVFRFGEVEIEGRMKSPQIIYFLRRVRAEFGAGDLGHRSFQRELSETRTERGM